jgi:plastocyanin
MTDDLTFEPARVVLHAGDTVEWKNTSSMPHTVTADARRAAEGKKVVLPPGAAPFDSGRIAPGSSYRHTFTVPGTYKYICIPHAVVGMAGEVMVKPRHSASSHPLAEAPAQPRHDAMQRHHERDADKTSGWPSGLAGSLSGGWGSFIRRRPTSRSRSW